MNKLGKDDFPFVSVIVPVWNGASHVRRCLDAIAAQTYPANRFELIVIDNGSTDDTPAIVVAHPRARLLVEPVASSYRARNRGLAEARGEWALFTDADCVPAPGWIAAAMAAAERNAGAGVVGGRIDLFDETGNTSQVCADFEAIFSFNQQRTIAAGHSVTANWLSPIALLRAMGGFNAALKSGGDVEMSGRIAAAGHPIVYADDMIVSHPVRGSYGEIRGKYLRTLGGRWALRHGGPACFVKANAGLARATGARSLRVARHRSFTMRSRTALIAMLLRLHFDGLVELGRLVRGGEPRRS